MDAGRIIGSHRLGLTKGHGGGERYVELCAAVAEYIGACLSVRAIGAALDLFPVRALVPADSVIIFDARMVHRGLPNRSRVDRPVVSFDYYLR